MLEEGKESPSYVVRGGDGVDYSCRFEHHPALPAAQKLVESLQGASPSPTPIPTPSPSPIAIFGLSTTQLAKRLSRLEGTSISLATGWWTYRLTHGKKLEQIHVNEKEGHVEAVVSLGEYSGAEYRARKRIGGETPGAEPVMGALHEFTNGDVCDDTGKPRRATVKYKCCTGRGASDRLATVTEPSPCIYEATVCTLAACADGEEPSSRSGQNSGSTSSSKDKSGSSVLEVPGSARGTLEELKGMCFVLHHGWWQYELCVGKSVRQFHADEEYDPNEDEEEEEGDEEEERGGGGVDKRRKERRKKKGESGTKKRVTQQYLLGSFDSRSLRSWKDREKLRKAGETLPVPKDGILAGDDEPGVVLLPERPEESYVEEWYTLGAPCEPVDSAELWESSVPSRRRARVKYVCPRGAVFDRREPFFDETNPLPHGPDPLAPLAPASPSVGLISVKEVQTCVYELIVHAPSLCNHPKFAPTRGPPPVRLHCTILDDPTSTKTTTTPLPPPTPQPSLSMSTEGVDEEDVGGGEEGKGEEGEDEERGEGRREKGVGMVRKHRRQSTQSFGGWEQPQLKRDPADLLAQRTAPGSTDWLAHVIE